MQRDTCRTTIGSTDDDSSTILPITVLLILLTRQKIRGSQPLGYTPTRQDIIQGERQERKMFPRKEFPQSFDHGINLGSTSEDDPPSVDRLRANGVLSLHRVISGLYPRSFWQVNTLAPGATCPRELNHMAPRRLLPPSTVKAWNVEQLFYTSQALDNY